MHLYRNGEKFEVENIRRSSSSDHITADIGCEEVTIPLSTLAALSSAKEAPPAGWYRLGATEVAELYKNGKIALGATAHDSRYFGKAAPMLGVELIMGKNGPYAMRGMYLTWLNSSQIIGIE